MLIFSRFVLLYYCLNSGMKAAAYLSYPRSISPLAPAGLIIFACLAIAALYLAYKLNKESQLTDKLILRYFTKIFASFIGLISIVRAGLALLFVFQNDAANQVYVNVLLASLVGHIATIMACTYLVFYHFRKN